MPKSDGSSKQRAAKAATAPGESKAGAKKQPTRSGKTERKKDGS